MTPRWVPLPAVLAIHDMLIAEHGGAGGMRSEGLLDSALASPRHLDAYESPDLFAIAARYANSITRNHPFHDGNKRVAFVVAGVFLEMNGLRLIATEADAVSAVEALSARLLSEPGFAQWLRMHSTAINLREKPALKGARRASPPRKPVRR